MNKIAKIISFLSIFTMGLSTISFTQAHGSLKPLHNQYAESLEQRVTNLRKKYEVALTLFNQLSELEKIEALDRYIIEKDSTDIFFKKYITELNQTISDLSERLIVPDISEYEQVKKDGRELVSSLQELNKYLHAYSIKKQIIFCQIIKKEALKKVDNYLIRKTIDAVVDNYLKKSVIRSLSNLINELLEKTRKENK